MKIIPLSFTQVNWFDFSAMANEVVGHSPTRALDDANIRPGDPFTFIASLEELISPGVSPRDAVRRATHTLQHVVVSFLIHVSDNELFQLQNIPFLSISQIEGKTIFRQNSEHLLIITGNLLEWQNCLPLRLNGNPAKIELFGKIYELFKAMRLREIFDRV